MQLLKGQKCKLSDLTADRRLTLQVSAQFPTGSADISCFGVDSQNRLSDDRYFVFYNQTSAPDQAVVLETEGNFSRFAVDLDKLPPSVCKLVITAAIDGSFAMSDLVSGSFTLLSGEEILAGYAFSGDQFSQEKALILCELYQKDGVWRLSVVSSGFNGGLSALLAHFGGEEVTASPQPAAPKKPVVPPAAPIPPKKEPPAPVQSPAPAPAPEPAPAKSAPIQLKKSGETHKISLTKNRKEIHVNLNWNTGVKKKGFLSAFGPAPVDLDLACMFRLKTGESGVIQALGNSFGCASDIPYILLDQDDRTGTSENGENMYFTRPDQIGFAIVFAYIYEGAPSWKNTNAAVTLSQQGAPDIKIEIDSANNRDRFCVIASLTSIGDQLEVRREERFFTGHREVDKAYGFGFRWQAGKK